MIMPDEEGATLAKDIKGDSSLASISLVLLSPHGACGDAREVQDAGFAACLMKPIKRSQLKDCLRMLVGNKMTGQGAQKALIHSPSLAAEKAEPKRILLVEDNLTNQKVALGILIKIGYQVDVAANGQEALKAFEKKRYDLILMDLQMPKMDGYAATAAIRKAEEKTGLHLPIIAMTAHAMRGDRELCLEKGMDDYISKPI